MLRIISKQIAFSSNVLGSTPGCGNAYTYSTYGLMKPQELRAVVHSTEPLLYGDSTVESVKQEQRHYSYYVSEMFIYKTIR
jgi:hypothetical protein